MTLFLIWIAISALAGPIILRIIPANQPHLWDEDDR
jgi:hypothetical protein